MFMGLPSLAFDCLREAITGCGIDADAYSFDEGIPDCAAQYDVFLMFLARYEAGTLTPIARIMDELRERMSKIPAIALIEDVDTDAAAFRRLGFSTVITGLPSVRFAVDLVQFILLSAGHAARNGSAAPEIGGDLCADIDVNVCFTRREAELLELLRRGMPNKIIAHELGISASTVKAHLHNIMAKLHATNRTQAISLLGQVAVRRPLPR